MATSTLDDLLRREIEIETTMAKLSSQLEELTASLAHVRIQIIDVRDVNRDVITRKLPNEIIAAIFMAGLALTQTPCSISWVSPQQHGTMREKPFEILVSSISRDWRSIALQTSRLWSDIHINVSRFTAGDMIDQYLSRSKSCLIDIAFTQFSGHTRMYLNRKDPLFDSQSFGRCLGQLVPHIARWRQFVVGLYIEDQVTAVNLSALVDLCAPALRRMVIDCDCRPPEVLEVFSMGAPLLSHMECNELFLLPPPSMLTSVTLAAYRDQLSYVDLRRLLLHMQSLTHLRINADIVAGTDIATSDHPAIKMPSVISLDLDPKRSREHQSSVGVLCFLDLPALETLTILGTMIEITEAFATHRRLYPVLHTLQVISKYWLDSLDSEDVAPTTIREFIRFFPNVRDLAFEGTLATPLLRTLCEAKRPDELLWPQLSAIKVTAERWEVSRCSGYRLIFPAIMDVVGNRVSLGHPISRIILSSPLIPRGNEKQQERLRALVDFEVCHVK